MVACLPKKGIAGGTARATVAQFGRSGKLKIVQRKMCNRGNIPPRFQSADQVILIEKVIRVIQAKITCPS
jgi:hypothetical protein